MFVVALGLSFFGLMLLTEVSAAAFFTMECVVGNKLTHKNKVAKMDSLVELDIESFFLTGYKKVGIELFTKCFQQL